MITKEQLQVMSDFEVNKALAEMLGMTVKDYALQVCLCGYDGMDSTWDERDYCNTPNDIMPLAFEYKLCLISPHSHTKTWSARQTDGGGLWSVSDFTYSDTNPLRAIACCLILVLQEQKQ